MLVEAVRRAASLWPNQIATLCADRVRTHRDHSTRIARLAGGMVGLGVSPGDRIGILAANSDYYLEALLATWWCGATTVPMNCRWSLSEHLFSVDDAEIKFIFHDEAHAATAAAIAAARPGAVRTLAQFPSPTGGAAALCTEALIEGSPEHVGTTVSPDLVCGIFYTGGTTGTPKGVAHTHGSLWSAAMVLALALGGPAQPRYLHAAPMFHLGDLGQAFRTTLMGGSHVFLPSFNASQMIALIAQHKITNVLLVPTMVAMMLEAPEIGAADLSSLEVLTYGGSPISLTTLQRTRKALPRVQLVQGFGQTETCGVGAVLPDSFHTEASEKITSAGRPAAGVSLKITDAHGQDVPNGVMGHICLRGPFVMQGYWNRPEETAAALSNGWLRTGDAGYIDEDGFLYVCDRVKDMIISGGENVYSAEVERALASHPAVAQVAVIGVPDERWGERVHAVIVPRPGASISYEDVYEHCKALIAGYKVPRSMELRSEMPLSPVGKILKQELRKPYWAGVSRNVA